MADPRQSLVKYSESLLRSVADSLVKPRTKFEVEELIDRFVATLDNAAVIDRRIRDLPVGPRMVIEAVARSRQTIWKTGPPRHARGSIRASRWV